MTTADALLASVVASPDDDLPRLVYADWCEENGDPDRAEFIRLQIERAKDTLPPAGRVREKVLLQTYGEAWLAPLRQLGGPLATQKSHGQFRRGFVEAVWMPAGWFVKTAERLFALSPVTQLLAIFDTAVEFGLLAGYPHLSRLRELDVCERRFGPGPVVQLCRTPHLSRLRVLRLPGCGIDDRNADGLCDSWVSPAVLDLRHNPLSDTARTHLRKRFGDAVLFE